MILNNNLHIGQVKELQSKRFTVNIQGKKVSSVTPKCGSCTKVISFTENTITLDFKASEIPYHLNTNTQHLSKSVDVYYEDGTSEIFTFRVIVIAK